MSPWGSFCADVLVHVDHGAGVRELRFGSPIANVGCSSLAVGSTRSSLASTGMSVPEVQEAMVVTLANVRGVAERIDAFTDELIVAAR